MTEQREAELLAKVDMLAANETNNHHKTCDRILHRCYIIIGGLAGVSLLLGCFVYDYSQVRVEMKALRETQTKAHRIMWVSENVGNMNLKTGSPVSPKGVLGRTIALVKSPTFNWDWPFQHPINPGQTFRDFAEQSDHPFARELKKHLDNPEAHWQKGQGRDTNQKMNKKPNNADDET